VDVPSGKALKLGFSLFVVLSLTVFAASYLGVHSLTPLDSNRVALVRVEGPIMDSRETVETIRAHQHNGRVKAMVLRVDSPGGGVVPSQEIHDAVADFAATGKKVVVSMGNVAASGGYYIAAPSDLIIANPGTLTGSIGVIMSLANFESLLDKIGVSNITIKAGANKDVGSPFRQMTDSERALLQEVMDDIHNQFISAVAAGRNRTEEEIRPLADGRIYSGRQALAVGLVDELGNLETAISRAGELAGIIGRPKVVERRKPAWERLTGNIQGALPWLPGSVGGQMGPRAMYLMAP
jgi:protease-4